MSLLRLFNGSTKPAEALVAAGSECRLNLQLVSARTAAAIHGFVSTLPDKTK
jgi:hypothetical protein